MSAPPKSVAAKKHELAELDARRKELTEELEENEKLTHDCRFYAFPIPKVIGSCKQAGGCCPLVARYEFTSSNADRTYAYMLKIECLLHEDSEFMWYTDNNDPAHPWRPVMWHSSCPLKSSLDTPCTISGKGKSKRIEAVFSNGAWLQISKMY